MAGLDGLSTEETIQLKVLSPSDRIMNEFYKNYPDLDPHSADRHCVASILEFVLKEFADIAFVVRDLREGDVPS